MTQYQTQVSASVPSGPLVKTVRRFLHIVKMCMWFRYNCQLPVLTKHKRREIYFIQHFVSFLVLQSERAGCFTFIVLLLSCDKKCSLALPNGAVGRSVVCNCSIS